MSAEESPPSRRLTIDWPALCQAFEVDALHMLHYLDVETGRTVLVTDESFGHLDDPAAGDLPTSERLSVEFAHQLLSDEGERYREIPSRGERERHRDMRHFAAVVEDIGLRAALERALADESPRKPFLAVLVEAPEEAARWRVFQRRRLVDHAVSWLATQGIEPGNPPPRN